MAKKLVHIMLFSLLLFFAGAPVFAQSPGGSTVSCNMFIPNAFTPNGDEINERFVVGLSDNCRLLEYEMKIFDRWGRLVFETKSADPQEAWDGKIDGKDVQKGVYMWNVYAKVVPQSGTGTESVNRHGTVVLIR